jgi:hypothetical protein
MIAGMICVLGAAWMIWGENIRVYQRNSEAESTFGAMLPDLYAQGDAIVHDGGGHEKKIEAKGRTSGKALWVNVKSIARRNRYDHEFKIDPVMGTLPEELRATSAADVQTLVLACPNSMRNHQMQSFRRFKSTAPNFRKGWNTGLRSWTVR